MPGQIIIKEEKEGVFVEENIGCVEELRTGENIDLKANEDTKQCHAWIINNAFLRDVNENESASEGTSGTSVPDYSMANASTLKRHILSIHSSTKPFHCLFCKYRATHLKRHVMVKHTNEKPLCRKFQLVNFKIHILTHHTEERPHQCQHCKYKTVQLGNFKRHVAVEHFMEKNKTV